MSWALTIVAVEVVALPACGGVACALHGMSTGESGTCMLDFGAVAVCLPFDRELSNS